MKNNLKIDDAIWGFFEVMKGASLVIAIGLAIATTGECNTVVRVDGVPYSVPDGHHIEKASDGNTYVVPNGSHILQDSSKYNPKTDVITPVDTPQGIIVVQDNESHSFGLEDKYENEDGDSNRNNVNQANTSETPSSSDQDAQKAFIDLEAQKLMGGTGNRNVIIEPSGRAISFENGGIRYTQYFNAWTPNGTGHDGNGGVFSLMGWRQDNISSDSSSGSSNGSIGDSGSVVNPAATNSSAGSGTTNGGAPNTSTSTSSPDSKTPPALASSG